LVELDLVTPCKGVKDFFTACSCYEKEEKENKNQQQQLVRGKKGVDENPQKNAMRNCTSKQ